jgi:hypothetical protein
MVTDNSFIYFYIGGNTKKLNPNTLELVGQTTGIIQTDISNNSFVVNSGITEVKYTSQNELEQLPYYAINNIRGE